MPIPLPEVEALTVERLSTGLPEFDRVLGGGIVPGSAVLVGGDPGIGKSTLLLQASGGLARRGKTALYVSGEESPAQTKLRAARLGLESAGSLVLAETEASAIVAHARDLSPDLLVVDSIQTVHRRGIASGGGSIAQVRECASELTLFAKETGVPVFLIGHVTKSGEIAGPRVLMHVVDSVLSFEGDRYHSYRVLRAEKNRFGATEEVGIFEMRQDGLAEVGSPAGLLLGGASPEGPGSVVVPAVEGTRVLLVEIQALSTHAAGGHGRRRVNGLDPGRIDLMLAVLQRKGGLDLAGQDVFVNAVGGVTLGEPGTDLALALAIASGHLDRPFPADTVAFGEVGLKGEVRPVARGRARLTEAQKLGFEVALVPPGTDVPKGIRAVEVARVTQALEVLGDPPG